MTRDTPTLPDDYYMSVEEIIEDAEGKTFRPHADDDEHHWLCDWCSMGVSYAKEPRIANYMADKVADQETRHGQHINSERKLTMLASYCPEHSHERLLFPTTEATEVRLMFTVNEDRTITDAEVTDVSPEGDGIPWNPRELAEKITEAPYEQMAVLSSANDMVMGPENILTYFDALGTGVDIREMVDWEGNIDPKALGRARKKLDEVKERRMKEVGDRQAFRDRVRGDKG